MIDVFKNVCLMVGYSLINKWFFMNKWVVIRNGVNIINEWILVKRWFM